MALGREVVDGQGNAVAAGGVDDVMAGISVSVPDEHRGHPGSISQRSEFGVAELGAEVEYGGASIAEQFLDGLWVAVGRRLPSR